MGTSNKTTNRHFEIFKKEANLWLDRLGLTEWRIDFFHGDNQSLPPDSCRAWFDANVEGMVGMLGLAPDWGGDRVTDTRVRQSAMHEVFHILLAQMSWLAGYRYSLKGSFEEEEHKVIRRFENLYYGHSGKKKHG
jgi:hypothetical protein